MEISVETVENFLSDLWTKCTNFFAAAEKKSFLYGADQLFKNGITVARALQLKVSLSASGEQELADVGAGTVFQDQ